MQNDISRIELLWPLALALRGTESTEQRLTTAKWLTGLILWVSREEGDQVGSVLLEQYAAEYARLAREGYVLQCSPLSTGSDAAMAARPRTAEEFWAAVPGHFWTNRVASS